MTVRWLTLGILIGLACLSPGTAFAHPHVWVDYYVTAVGGQGGITKLKFRWHFDDMFTSMVKEDFHMEKISSQDDVDTLRDKAFANLKNYHYYTYLRIDGKDWQPDGISDFGAVLENQGHNLEYTFTIALPHPAKKLEISLYDPEFYVDIGPPLKEESLSTGIMASAKMEPKDFVFTAAEPGAQAPRCTWKQGEPRVSETWGKFALFVVTCEAK